MGFVAWTFLSGSVSDNSELCGRDGGYEGHQ